MYFMVKQKHHETIYVNTETSPTVKYFSHNKNTVTHNWVLSQENTHRSMEQNTECRYKPKYIWPINI